MLDEPTQRELDTGLSFLQQSLGEAEPESASVDRFGFLEEGVNYAQRTGLIAGLPSKRDQVKHYDIERLELIADRLANLGYFKRSEAPSVVVANEIDIDLKYAILAFQQEANLIGDGWVGDLSWQVLQQLVTFEEDKHLDAWFDRHGQPKAVLCRAIALRLYTLGVAVDKPTSQMVPPLQLDGLRQVAEELGLASGSASDRQLIECLFDQDRIVDRLASLSVKCLSEAATQFVIAAAKIELWLIDSKQILPDGELKEEHKRAGGGASKRVSQTQSRTVFASSFFYANKNLQIRRGSHLYKAIRQALLDYGLSRGKASDVAKYFASRFSVFFKTLADAAVDDELDLNGELQKVIQQGNAKVVDLWGRAKGFLGKLYDGFKRFLKIFSKIYKTVERGLNFLSRHFYRVVVDAFAAIKLVIGSVTEGFRFLFSPILHDIPNSNVIVRRSCDADSIVIIDAKYASEMAPFMEKLQLNSKKLVVSARLLGEFMGLLKSAFLSSFFGWWAFFVSAVNFYKTFSEAIQALRNLEGATA